MTADVLVIGVGDPACGDDAAGSLVATLLRRFAADGIAVADESGDPADLLKTWHEAPTVVIVDTIRSGASPGTVRRIDAGADPLPEWSTTGSTRAAALAQVIELARRRDRLPQQLIVYGIEGRHFRLGAGLSPEVCAAARTVAQRIAADEVPRPA